MADPLRLLHFADLHLGVQAGGRLDPSTGLNRRIVDVCERFDALCDAAEAQDVHAVLFAGDAFNNQHPNPTLQRLFAERVRRLARSGIGVFLLIGNHDLPKAAALAHPFSIYDALEVERVVVGDRARVYRLPLRDGAPAPELQIAALPHFSKHAVLAGMGEDITDPDAVIQENLTKTVRALGDAVDPSLPAVFVGHCHVNQADIGTTQAKFDVSDIEVTLSTLVSGQPFPYFALGHIHKRQVLANDPFVAYPGSLERIDYGEGERVDVAATGVTAIREAEPKGFYRFDLDASWQLAEEPRFEEIAARRFITLRLGELAVADPMDDLTKRVDLARAGGVAFDDAFVRVKAALAAPDRARVSASAVRSLFGEAYDVRLVLEVSTPGAVRDPRFAARMSESEALDRFLETRDDWVDDRDELRRLGRELMAEVTAKVTG